MKLGITFFVLAISIVFQVQCFDFAGIELPDLEMPELAMPELEMPELEMPELEMPELEMPELDMPEFPDFSDFTGMMDSGSAPDIPSSVPDSLSNSVSTVQDSVQNLPDTASNVKDTVQNLPGTATNVKDTIEGSVKNLPGTASNVQDTVQDSVQNLPGTIANSKQSSHSSEESSPTTTTSKTTSKTTSTTKSTVATTTATPTRTTHSTSPRTCTIKRQCKPSLKDFSSSLVLYKSPKVKESVKRCRNNINITKDEEAGILRREIPKTEDGECFLACIKKESGLITEDNRYNMKKIKYTLEPLKISNDELYDKVVNIFDICETAGIYEEDDCDAGKKLRKCVQDRQHQMNC